MSEKSAKQFLLLIRHGESFANRKLSAESDGIYYSTAGSDVSVGLTDEGTRQARNAAEYVLKLLPAGALIDRLWLNRFERVRTSADLIVESLGYEPERTEDNRLEKRSYGKFWNLTYRGVSELHQDEYQRFLEQGAVDYRPPDGENYHDLFARVDSFIREHLGSGTGNHLIITSSAVVLSFRRALAGLPDKDVVELYESVALPNGHIDVYVRREENMPWSLIGNAAMRRSEASR